MKTQYPCNNSKNEIHIWRKYGKFHCVLPGTATESPKNCEHFSCLGYDNFADAFDAAAIFYTNHEYIESISERGEVK